MELKPESVELEAGEPITDAWTWGVARLFRALWPAKDQQSDVVLEVGTTGLKARLRTAIPQIKFFVTPSEGIPGRDPSTGALGSGDCVRHDLKFSGATLLLVPSSPEVSEVVYNWSKWPAGNSKLGLVLCIWGINLLFAEDC